MMVVDDAADARFLIGVILGDAEDITIVAEAEGGREALEVIEEHDPDIVLVDARMPAMDGYELTRTLVERRPGQRVALLTSVVDAVIEREARQAGATACWSKADFDRLAEQIRGLAA